MQIYLRKIGELGKWYPQLDWAYGDYRFKDWFGTQDAEFLHIWALLPESVCPTDLGSNNIAHVGGGKLDYTGYAGAGIDINRFWNVKLEGHFINGYGDTYSAHGFFTTDNPKWLQTEHEHAGSRHRAHVPANRLTERTHYATPQTHDAGCSFMQPCRIGRSSS